QADYREIRFSEYGMRLRESRIREEVDAVEVLPTRALLGSSDPEYQAQLHWRLTLPVLCLVVTLLAVPLSRVNPRQGRYARLLPSILLYLIYITMLTSVRSQIEKKGVPVAALWAVHGLFLLAALNFHLFGGYWSRLFAAIGAGLASLLFWRGGKA
ncbi:MAG TPA: LptF/LptG family permease, partial [Motiliproteus sp.]